MITPKKAGMQVSMIQPHRLTTSLLCSSESLSFFTNKNGKSFLARNAILTPPFTKIRHDGLMRRGIADDFASQKVLGMDGTARNQVIPVKLGGFWGPKKKSIHHLEL